MSRQETLQTEVENAYSSLRALMLDNDPYALRHETQETLILLFYSLGKLLAHDPSAPLPELSPHLVADASRHAGNRVLAGVGSDQQYEIAHFSVTTDRDSATTIALSFLHGLVEHWYVQLALCAYRAVAEEDSDEYEDEYEKLDKAVQDFQTIAKIYHDGLINSDGMRALLLVARNTDEVQRFRQDVHESITVPWFLNIAEYDKYAEAVAI